MHFADTAKTIITLCNKDLKMFGLETNFESTRPIPHHVETKYINLSSRPRPRPRPQKIGLETYITATYTGTSSRRLCVRVKEHLSNSQSNKRAVREYIQICKSCSENKSLLNSFSIIGKCNSAYKAKIQEALIIKNGTLSLTNSYTPAEPHSC